MKFDIEKLHEKVRDNQRIDIDEGLYLYNNADFLTLASLADSKRYKFNPEKIVTYVIDRNINYTNICVSGCKFCAFFKKPGGNSGYVITKKELFEKIEETIELGGTQILLQGGMNPELNFDYYIDLLKFIKDNFDIHVHGFSPTEINYIAEKSSFSIEETIIALKQAGLDSIPGGGAEILCDEIRKKISPDKCMSEPWLNVMEKAHGLGMRTTATMMFGHVEEPLHIFKHLNKLRNLQDKTKGFTAFIPWTFQPDNTRIKVVKKGASEYLRVLALSRIFLDNFDNIQASWVTQGDKIAQVALFYGANDMGSTMIEENVVASAGVDFMLPEKELKRLISEAGFEPKQRDCYYNLL
ncbi:MAG: dehypoxanthine futalosine cyclase [Desulfobacteraceae bacterium]|nr:dehypoxanthine futalosine cyclase [Desulfobacteraceae bacterium]